MTHVLAEAVKNTKNAAADLNKRQNYPPEILAGNFLNRNQRDFPWTSSF